MISKNDFFDNEFISGGDKESNGKVDVVLMFLKKNNSSAFLCQEISKEVKVKNNLVQMRLANLKRNKKVLNNKPYWTYNDDNVGGSE